MRKQFFLGSLLYRVCINLTELSYHFHHTLSLNFIIRCVNTLFQIESNIRNYGIKEIFYAKYFKDPFVMKKTLLRSTAINTQTTSVDFMTAKKQTTKLTSAKSSTFVLPICIILRI